MVSDFKFAYFFSQANQWAEDQKGLIGRVGDRTGLSMCLVFMRLHYWLLYQPEDKQSYKKSYDKLSVIQINLALVF